MGAKNPWIAALLSLLIVGAGQLYVGDNMAKALGLLVAGFVVWILSWLTLVFFVILFGLYAFSIYDAYTGAQKWNLARGYPEGGS